MNVSDLLQNILYLNSFSFESVITSHACQHRPSGGNALSLTKLDQCCFSFVVDNIVVSELLGLPLHQKSLNFIVIIGDTSSNTSQKSLVGVEG